MKLAKYIVLILIVLSCKKDKLIGEKEILVGTWIWDYSIISNVGCTNNDKYIKTNDVYEIIFKEKGKVEFYKNSELVSKHRVVCTFDKINTDHYIFWIFLDNKKDRQFIGRVGVNSLQTNTIFPFDSESCMAYTNYFVRK
jgi:hypothetical protein